MIEICDVSYHYPGEEEDRAAPYALRQVTLEIGDGEFIGFLGRNGSGKSTLARMLNGLLLPDEGTVTVDGRPTSDPSAVHELRQSVQLVFQNPENQIVGVNVEEEVAFGLSNFGYPHEEMEERICRALRQAGLEGRRQLPVFELSGGEKQKLALASVLALSPRYLILDEATSMLDPGARKSFLQTLHRLREESGFGLIHITHHLEEVWNADRLVLFRDGRIEAAGKPQELLKEPELLEEGGVEIPYLPAVAARLRRHGINAPLWPNEEELLDLICKSH